MPESTGESTEPTVLTGIDKTTGVGTITLNRPRRRNALSKEMLQALDEAVRDLATDDAVRAIILTGSGESFCSGVDTDELPAARRSPPGWPRR